MDQELVTFLSQQFADLRGEMDERFADLRGEMSRRFDEVDGRFDEVDARIDKVDEEVRLAHVSIEGLRGDIRLVADGVITANERIDAVRTELKEEIGDVKSLLHTSYRDLDRRVRKIESSRQRAGRVAAAKD